ncbi:tetrahydrofolate dehydrogenase/cyclohydrolase catalytic domain-containing protein [Ralstonia sp. R-29]|uniref:tetrahydrofolate dehydrogenase/cyclohydrolase catalytic domain-containing protein n=1 Tax=Ralstonia sp. R-29 TaxID=3404059 RepID=UPI003CF29B82
MTITLDGKALAAHLEIALLPRVEAFKKRHGYAPVLATILVGSDLSSATYVRMKGNACRRVGMASKAIELPESATTADVLAVIDALNADSRAHGILLQHPVPRHVDERRCFDHIHVAKDVDGVTSHGFGKMALGEPAFGSATPAGVMRLLAHYNLPIEGKLAVVVGRSPILGKPMALMLSNANATVTLCHSKTADLEAAVRSAEIVVAAIGKPRFIQSHWISNGAVVVDAGYHPGGIGDVDHDGLMGRCAALTPVPGGVGPMTISTLIGHTLAAAEQSIA